MINSTDLAYLQIQTGATKEEIQSAITAVGNNPDDIEQYLQQKSKPHLIQLLNSDVVFHPNQVNWH
jgi:hypothetical protein